jgi:outer membrane receptor protein involved in Fe transport
MKSRYLISCAVAAMLSGTAAQAATAPQTADTSPATTAATDAKAGPDATTPVADPQSTDANGGDIIVTAQRRNESIQKVPVTIQAFTGETLTQLNVKNFNDLVKYTPNVTFSNNGPGQGNVFMRGLSAGFAGGQSSATIGNFPNVALYLDDQSMQFPSRNIDIYAADIERVEILEGPQGTLFGGGAEAGAVRYITNKPKLDRFEGSAEAMYGFTSDGAPNNSEVITLNVPIVKDKFAVRGTFYNERRGGYIDNVYSTFTRSDVDPGNSYLNIKPNGAGICPDGGTTPTGFCTVANGASGKQINNGQVAEKDFNPVTYTGARLEAQWDINEDWSILITESLQSLDARGGSQTYPTGSDFQKLGPLQVTTFTPEYNKDRFNSTSWTVHGKLGPLSAIYTGSYLSRKIDNQTDYTNYSRTAYGIYYTCIGGNTPWKQKDPATGKTVATPASCYSPATYWRDQVKNTHLTNEFRISSPDTWRLRFIAGFFQETFRIGDNMNFEYKTVPSCTPANLANANAGGTPCAANVSTFPGADVNFPGERDDNTGFGEDVKRGYTQLAGFGSVDFDIIPNVLTISGGTRYYNYKEYESGAVYSTGPSCLDVVNGTCGFNTNISNNQPGGDHVTYHGFKSRASLNWNVTSTTLAYFTFSQGFRPGGFNRSQRNVANGPAVGGPAQFLTPNAYSPDSLDNYEIGLKTSMFDRKLQINISAYNMNWKNVQFAFYAPLQLGNTTFLANGPNYNIKGGEIQLTARPVSGLSIFATATYNNERQTSSPCLVSNVAGQPTAGSCITTIKGIAFPNPFGVIGATAAFAPKWQAAGRIRYDWAVGSVRPYAQVGATFTDDMYNKPANYTSGEGVLIPATTFLRYLQPAYATVDASLGLNTEAGWNAELFVNNLTNSLASTFTSTAQFIRSDVPLRPRTFGMKVGYKF